jgi:hypothetical protein
MFFLGLTDIYYIYFVFIFILKGGVSNFISFFSYLRLFLGGIDYFFNIFLKSTNDVQVYYNTFPGVIISNSGNKN